MTLWHYLGAFLGGSVVTLSGAFRCAAQRRWGWAATGCVPFAAFGIWIWLIWTRTDWDSRLLDQEAWILLTETTLLLVVWVTGIEAWRIAIGHSRQFGAGADDD